MLTELYIEALLADEALADEVWVLWTAGVITDEIAAWAWAILGSHCCGAREIGARREKFQ
jgi:hypothetical protein